jgi:hypothetical protein
MKNPPFPAGFPMSPEGPAMPLSDPSLFRAPRRTRRDHICL